MVLWGLIFSCGGDALLNVGLFPHGMALFGAAQIFYIRSFGWKPLKFWIGAIAYLAGIAGKMKALNVDIFRKHFLFCIFR